MKKLLFIFFLFPTYLFAQNYTEVIQVPGKSSKELYVSGKEWFVSTFKSAKDVLQMDEPELGKLVGKGYTRIENSVIIKGSFGTATPINMDMLYIVKISTKDGRYKYEFTDITAGDASGMKPFSEQLRLIPLFKSCKTEEGAKSYLQKQGQKTSKWMIKTTMTVNPAYAENIENAELQIKMLIESLKAAMNSNDDNW